MNFESVRKTAAWAKYRADCTLLFHGGGTDCER